MAVEYQEMPGSPVENLAGADSTATCVYVCKWEDRYDVYNELINSWYPHAWGDSLLCTTIGITPFPTKIVEAVPGDPTLGKHDHAIVTCNYKTISGNTPDEGDNPMGMTYFDEELVGNGEFLTLSKHSFWWHKYTYDPTGSAAETEKLSDVEAPAFVLYSLDWNLSYKDVIFLPDYTDFIGKVNDREIVSPTLDKIFPPETLLFHPPSQRRSVNTLNPAIPVWDLDLAFSYKPETWNKFYWPEWKEFQDDFPGVTGPWNQIVEETNVSSTDPYHVYELVDMTPILPPGAYTPPPPDP